MPFFSVIIPVYNVEKYLDQCIRSILTQPFKDLEAILVDDGSTDSSGKMCDDWAAQDSRVRVIHQQNGGPSKARNKGIASANGKWILFLDGDDYWPADSLARLVVKMKKWPDQSLYVGKWMQFSDGAEAGTPGVIYGDFTEGLKQFDKLSERVFFLGNNCGWAVWKLAVKKQLILESKATFLEDVRVGEEIYFLIKILEEVKTICCLNEVFCCYRVQTSNTLSEVSAANSLKAMDSFYLTIWATSKISMPESDREKVLSELLDIYVFHSFIAAEESQKEQWKIKMDKHKTLMKYPLRLFHSKKKLLWRLAGKWTPLLWGASQIVRSSIIKKADDMRGYTEAG